MDTWRDLTYLKRGNHRQRQAYTALRSLDLFPRLAAYDPVLAGTIPLGIDIITSDLDVICAARDLPEFSDLVTRLFGAHTGFEAKIKDIRGRPTVIARFEHAGFPIEIFAQDAPVEQQNAYRHLVVEHRLLTLGGAPLAETIRQLKQDGLGTEPAFARVLRLPGDPYLAILDLESSDDAALTRLLDHFSPRSTLP